jgi:UDP-N-acetylglucosamine:LPS N-acetylglucosamine transferase
LERIGALLSDPAALTKMAEASRAQGRLGVAEQVAGLIETRFTALASGGGGAGR